MLMGLGWSGIYRIHIAHRSGAAQIVVGSLVAGTCGVVAIGRLDFASSGGGSCRG
jgi:hypothetical protein